MNLSNWPKELLQESIEALSECSISKVRKVLQKIRKLPDKVRGKDLRLGIIRTFTIEAQLDFISLALGMLPANVKIKAAELESIEQELLYPESNLLTWKPDIILVLWRLEDLIPNFYFNTHIFSTKEYTYTITKMKKRINNLVGGYKKISKLPLILSTLPMSYEIDLLDLNIAVSYRKTVEEINSIIFKCNNNYINVYLFDFVAWSALFGRDAFNRKMDFFARQPISAKAIGSFANAIARTLRPFVLPNSKVIALDLDNVLWGGILAEDGLQGIKIGYDFPGNIYYSIQKFILKLKNRGFLLVLLSKNNINDVKKAFSELPYMPLKFNNFDAVQVNWNDKYKNIKKIAEDFNLGLDSFVFVDDQHFEQEQMKYNLPQVKILPVTEDPLSILTSLEKCWFFDQLTISSEDMIRSKDYSIETKRISLKKSIKNHKNFLKSLDLKTTIRSLNEENINRAFQMLIKTNQFNLRSKKHSEAELQDILNNSNNVLLTLSLSDRFGEQGIVGLIIGLIESEDTIFVDSFLISCRAIGRGAEQALWYVFLEKVKKRKIKTIRTEYIRSQKNSQVSDLYDRLDMKRVEENTINTIYKNNLPYKINKPDWIKIIF